jgi:hypothetical protein
MRWSVLPPTLPASEALSAAERALLAASAAKTHGSLQGVARSDPVDQQRCFMVVPSILQTFVGTHAQHQRDADPAVSTFIDVLLSMRCSRYTVHTVRIVLGEHGAGRTGTTLRMQL